MTLELLTYYNFNFVNLGKPYKGTIEKIRGLAVFDMKLLKIARKFKPDFFLSAGSMYAAQVAWLLRKPHITIEDTYNMEQVRLYRPFTQAILTADYVHPSMGKREIRYSGYQELAYLHPNRFTPDESVLQELGVGPGKQFVLLRFVSWEATHDKGHTGMASRNKIEAVHQFEQFAKVFISSEKPLPAELDDRKIRIHPARVHHAIAFASLIFGESSTMTSEAAALGTPSIYLNDNSTHLTLDEEKRYELVFNYSESSEDQEKAIQKGCDLLKVAGLKNEWRRRRDLMLNDKIDVTAFLAWFVENYPESPRIMKENPHFQDRFRSVISSSHRTSVADPESVPSKFS